MEILRVSAKTDPKELAGAIAGSLRERGKAECHAIGAGAVNQAVKGIAIARGFAATSGTDVICVPFFFDSDIDGRETTGIGFRIERR